MKLKFLSCIGGGAHSNDFELFCGDEKITKKLGHFGFVKLHNGENISNSRHSERKRNTCHCALVAQSLSLVSEGLDGVQSKKMKLNMQADAHNASRKAAFTLAEVLITLGIIGVVAALTLPSLVANYKKSQYVNGLKAGYSILNNGFRQMMAEEGVDDIEDTELFAVIKAVGSDTDTVASEQAAAKVISKYFQKARLISRADLITKSSCKDLVGKGPRMWNLGDKTQCSGNYNMQYALPNGMTMSIYLHDTCSKSSLSEAEIAAAGGKMTKDCGMIDLDLNGERNPNQWGRDGYRFTLIQNGSVVPMYGKDELINLRSSYFTSEARENYIKENCNPKSTTSKGFSCAARIIELDNWEMKY